MYLPMPELWEDHHCANVEILDITLRTCYQDVDVCRCLWTMT